jgi:4-hydroxymandelate synthase
MHRIAYVELNVDNAYETAAYFTDCWDFVTLAEAHLPGRHSILLHAGEIQLVVSGPDGPGGQVRDWLDRHGEGVADVALYCRDAAEITEIGARAVAAGLPILRGGDGSGTATVDGLGTIRHTLVAATKPIAPPGFPWVDLPAGRPGDDGPSPAARIRTIDHVALCLPRGLLHATADLYQDVFGLYEVSREVIQAGDSGMDSRVLRDESGTLTYVIAEPTADSRGGQIEVFVEAHGGGGVPHLAFSTTDICAAVDAYTRRGVGFCSTPGTYYDQVPARLPDHSREIGAQLEDLRRTGVLVTSDNGGLLHQIFSTNPHRAEMFYELIQRGPGATGFGNDNVIALFAARAAALAEAGAAR